MSLELNPSLKLQKFYKESSILEQIHQVKAIFVCKFNLNNSNIDKDGTWEGIIAEKYFVVQCT